MNMSARAYDRILKVARTIAELEGTYQQLIYLIFLMASAHEAPPTSSTTSPNIIEFHLGGLNQCEIVLSL